MSLYYELDPADADTPPQLPPLLKAEEVDLKADVHAKAIGRAAAGAVGLVCYGQRDDMLDMAITLAPEVTADKAIQVHYLLMIAIGDAIGAAAPPEVSVGYQFPGTILLNRGIAGNVRVSLADKPEDGQTIPAWMVVGLQLRLKADMDQKSLDYRMSNSSLEEEGAGFISRTRLLESCCRHFLAWLHKWEEEGFRPLFDMWSNRVEHKVDLISVTGQPIEWLGLDENGAGLLKAQGKAHSVSVLHADQFIRPVYLD